MCESYPHLVDNSVDNFWKSRFLTILVQNFGKIAFIEFFKIADSKSAKFKDSSALKEEEMTRRRKRLFQFV